MTYSPDRLEQRDAQFRAAGYLVVGDGEAETGGLAALWHSPKFPHMLAMNGISRYGLAIEPLERAPLPNAVVDKAIVRFEGKLSAHRAYIREQDEEVTGWRGTDPSVVARGATGGE